MNKYRALIVRTTLETPKGFDLTFTNSPIGLWIDKSWAVGKGITEILIGDKVLVKGRRGNSDIDLWGVDALEDMQMVDASDTAKV